MDTNSFLIVAGCVFALAAVIQIARVTYRWPIRIASLNIPLAVSWVAMAIASALAVWAFRLVTL